MKQLIVLGSGGYGHTVADVAAQMGYSVIFLDDAIPEHPLSSFIDYLPSTSQNKTTPNTKVDGQKKEVEFIVAFGNNFFRLEWIEKLENHGAKLATLIHPSSYISPTSTINNGTVILPHAIINTDVTIGKGCIINCGSIIDHGCVIEDGCHICLGAIAKSENHIEKCSKIEAGEVVERNTRK